MTPSGADRKKVEILIVEDNPGDVYLLRQALEETGASLNISVANDGEEAFTHLFEDASPSVRPRPDLVLLDINLPKKSGHDVLRAMREDPRTQHTPVVVMSSSRSGSDVRRAYELHANSYVQKPHNLDDLGQIISAIEAFWLRVAELPPKSV